MKKKKPLFSPMCEGCEELDFLIRVKVFVAKAKKQGIYRWIPEKWKKEVYDQKHRDNHIEGCRWRGYTVEKCIRKIRRIRENS